MVWPSISVVNCGKRIERGLLRAPVESVPPVLRQASQVVDRNAPAPAGAFQLARPAGVRQPLAQVVEIRLRNLDAEGFHVCVLNHV